MGRPNSLRQIVAPEADTPLGAPLVTVEAIRIRERVCWLPADAIVTTADVAAIFGVAERTVERWDIVRAYPSPQRPVMLWSDVLDYVKRQRAA